MTVKEILADLKSRGDETRRKHNIKAGARADPVLNFGVPLGDIRTLAKKIKSDHDLALKLWDTGNLEAQLLATLIIKPTSLSADDLDRLTRSTSSAQVADWFNSYVVAQHPDKAALRDKWMSPREKDRWAARAGWHFTASAINKGGGKEPSDAPSKGSSARSASASDSVTPSLRHSVTSLLDRIEKQMPKAAPEVQWTMNNTLMAIGIHHAAHRKRAIAIGEKIGLYKDWPQSKGCIIPYAPTAIEALAKRKG